MGMLVLAIEDRSFGFEVEKPGNYSYRLSHLRPEEGQGVFPYLPLRIDQTLVVDRVYSNGCRFQLSATSWLSRSWGEAKESFYHCRICNDLYFGHYTGCPESEVMGQHHLCFSCAYWEIQSHQDDNTLILDGHKYLIGPGNLGGMGGRKFVIETFTGERIETRDLWHKGKVPEFFRSLLPDTARFVEGAKLIQHPDGSKSWEGSR